MPDNNVKISSTVLLFYPLNPFPLVYCVDAKADASTHTKIAHKPVKKINSIFKNNNT